MPLVKCAEGWWAAQVVWWSTLSEKYAEEMQQQADIFGGLYGEQARKDFRRAVTRPPPPHPHPARRPPPPARACGTRGSIRAPGRLGGVTKRGVRTGAAAGVSVCT